MSNGTKEASEAVAAWGKSLLRRGVANVETKIEVDGKTERFVLTATLHVHPDNRPPTVG
jgi:hypothetical protein